MNPTKKLQHLYWRAGFGLSPQEWQVRRNWSIEQAVDDLFERAKTIQPWEVTKPKDAETHKKMGEAMKKQFRQKNKQLVRTINLDWLSRMSNPNHSALLEKMTLFWHGHFACTIKVGMLAAQQLNSIQQHALGNFRDLVLAIARDPSMIRFLNNQQNKKRQPNENFARELMELFTIGRGFYTENDVKEAARAFTGWSSNLSGEYVFRERQHDFGEKRFMNKRGNFDGTDIIDILLERRETAHFITKKIYQYFVNEKVNERRLEQLAAGFYDKNYDIKWLMQTIFTSDWFYETENIGVQIKSPIALIAGMTKQLNLTVDNKKPLLLISKVLGQVLFNPPNVAGWPGGRNWIDNSTLMMRLNLAGMVFQVAKMDFQAKPELEEAQGKALKNMTSTIDLQPILAMTKDASKTETYDTLSDYFLQPDTPLKAASFERFIEKGQGMAYVRSLCLRLMTLPEYQLC
jgi:uncharacterized protein (DUF1800 family)